jgi:hypothetical protein
MVPSVHCCHAGHVRGVVTYANTSAGDRAIVADVRTRLIPRPFARSLESFREERARS